MKKFTVTVLYADGARDWFQSTRLEEARAMFNKWMADIQSVHVSIS